MTIAQVSEQSGLTPDTLRYYERIGLIPPVGRTQGGIRNYQEEDIGWIEFIKCMRSAGVGVEALNEYMELFRQGPETSQARKKLLLHEREKLVNRIDEMQQTLERMNHKIATYEEKDKEKCEDILVKSEENK
ncbi:transcriptional regulator, MerR family [Lachnospiraceae bacterium KM106-2]|nr:transcriptional regulator, MerR family [Lachnospiraceae bacterium KM106-2]